MVPTPGGSDPGGSAPGGSDPGGSDPGGSDPGGPTPVVPAPATLSNNYDLQVVADPADSLTQVTGFSLQRADTLNSTPTGLTLTFSGAIDPNSLMSNSPVLVYDASGKAWPMTLSSYDGSQCQVSFVFDQPLPPGQYTVVVPPSGGLADLTGRAPVSPGHIPGVLASFTVEPQTSPAVAGNLGVLWPSPQAQVSQFATIPPGQEFVSRVVVPVAGLYTLETSFTQGSVAILRAGPDGVAVIDPESTGPFNTYPMPLEAGVYHGEFSYSWYAAGGGSMDFHSSASIDHESIVNNGVGQSNALSLGGLVNSVSSSLTSGSPLGATTVLPVNVEPVFSPSSPQSGSNTVLVAAPVGSGEAVAATGVSVIPASLVVTVSTGLLGSPALQNEPVAVVGPVVAGGSTALARSSSGLLPGIIHESSGVSVIPASLVVTVSTGLLGSPALQNEPVAVVGPVVAGGSTALARSFSGLLPGIIYESSGVSVIPASPVVTVSTGLLGSPALQNEPVAVVGPVVAGGSTALARSFSGLLPGIIHESSGVSVIPASLVVTVSTGLLGTPALQNEPVAVVGPVVAGGSTALASSFSGLLPGIIYRSPGSLDERAQTQVDQGLVVGNSFARAEELAEAATSSSASPGGMLASSSSADALALTKADRITELPSRLGRWFGLNTGDEGSTVGGDLAEPDLLARNEAEAGRGPADRSGERETERMTEADLGMPTGLIVVAAAAYRLRQLAGRWWRRRCQVRVSSRAEARPPGPRSRSFRGSQGSHAAAIFVRASLAATESTSQG